MITALDKNTALVVIDLQKSVVQAAAARGANKVIQNAAKLVVAFPKAITFLTSLTETMLQTLSGL